MCFCFCVLSLGGCGGFCLRLGGVSVALTGGCPVYFCFFLARGGSGLTRLTVKQIFFFLLAPSFAYIRCYAEENNRKNYSVVIPAHKRGVASARFRLGGNV